MIYLRDMLEHAITAEHEASNDAWEERCLRTPEPHLHPSTVDGCPRAAILTAVQAFPDDPRWHEVTNPFDLYTQEVMHSGRTWEKVISEMLWGELGERYVPSSYGDNGHWTWEQDGVITASPSEMLPEGLIVEIKDTAEYNFRVKSRLPYRHHVVQLCVYKELAWPPMPGRLYYHGRGHWAEFDVRHDDRSIWYKGYCDEQYREGSFDFSVPDTMRRLEAWLDSGELPPREESRFTRSFGCVRGSDRKGYFPSCKWYHYCWPDKPAEGPFGKEEE